MALAAKGLLEALAKEDYGEPIDRNTAVDHDLGDVLRLYSEETVTCNKDCNKCKQLSGRTEKNGQPWGYECLKYNDTVERTQFQSTKTFRK